MKTIILAGGLGTRISEETDVKPKPMVLIDEKPILWHVMNIYSMHGFTEFIVATGYKGEVIRDWVSTLNSGWKIKAIDTGVDTQTAGRIRIAASEFDDDAFHVTYGDGVGNIDIGKLVSFHENHGKLATVTAVRPPARFGVLQSSNGLVTNFGEKDQSEAGWINGGFFILKRDSLSAIENDLEPFESKVLPRLVTQKELMVFHHTGFWKPMDTLRERNELAELAKESVPPWLVPH